MMGRLRDGILDILDELSLRLSQLRRGRPRRSYQGALKGNMRNVLVVKPESEVFSEAIFIVRDDYVRSAGISRQELLQQAREAARGYIEECGCTSRRRLFPYLAAALGLLGAAAVLLVIIL